MSEKKVQIITSDELAIAEMQLSRIKEIACQRLLTPDETKQYDLLVKNVMLLRGRPTDIQGQARVADDVPDQDLIAIAKQPPPLELTASARKVLKILDNKEEKQDVGEG